MRTVCALAMVFAAIAGGAAAQGRGPDALYLSAHIDSESSVSGAGTEVEWLHSRSERSSLLLGGATASAESLWWGYGTVGGLMKGRRLIVMARASLGPAEFLGERSSFVRIIATATVPIGSGFYADIEGQHASVLHAPANTFKIGGSYVTPRLSMRLAYIATVPSHAARLHSVSGRSDVTVGRLTLFGGTTMTAVEQSNGSVPLELLTGSRPTQDIFAGASFAAGQSRVIGTVEIVPRSTGRFARTTTTIQLPVGRQSGRSAPLAQ